VRNDSAAERLLLDFELDDFQIDGACKEGGQGKPVFVNEEAFFAVEHPAGVNQGEAGRVKLWHCPGCPVAPGETVRSQVAVAGVAPRGQVLEQFHSYLFARSPRRKKKRVSSYTCYGINNQWGGCGTLADQEVLSVQQVIREWQTKGVKFDYFTLDTGWPQNDSDLTEFASSCFPDGPAKVIEGVDALGMKFGMWFSVSWGGWANGSYPAIQQGAIPDTAGPAEPPTEVPVASYKNGYPVMGGVGRQMCLASEPYFHVFRDAVEHHVRHNKARLIKFDSGNYYCLSTAHKHLPGKYSTEAMFDRLINIAARARGIAPDLFVTWYWGAGSPFWALYGDIIAESGLFMEGSGTSWIPTIYYRDSVTLSIDQNTQFASLVPPLNKDSLGVWLSQIRWANFQGKERWRESLIMDFGRGSMVFPQLWGDPNLLGEDDVRFLAGLLALAREHEKVFLRQRKMFGDAWKNEPYGYSFFDGAHGFVFCNNVHFTSRKLRVPLPRRAVPLQVSTHFPERAEVGRVEAGREFEFWMRPFETVMLEVSPEPRALPPRRFNAARLGMALPLNSVEAAPWMELRFADGARFEKAGLRATRQCYSTQLPTLDLGRSVLSVVVSLANADGSEYRYKPVVVEIVQLRCRVGGRLTQMIPVPDARRFGNTQSAGCSWVLYKAPLAYRRSGEPVEFAVHAYLPTGVKATVEAWLTHQWWQENARPEADGYYGDAPS
ncbi:MAG: alpha-galactosidase, partial [Acidobacteria bacterium]|nr:alpha-galactosidase [Acidobacteriota bacterium]